MNSLESLIIIAAFFLGAIIGSYLNVVILRYGTGKSPNKGRSKCLSCGYGLKFWDLIPIFSWVFLRGRCRQCQAKISIQYPLIEIFTGLLFSGLASKLIFLPATYFGLAFVWYAIILSILVVIVVYDLRHKIIPNKLNYTFILMSFLQSLYLNYFSVPVINWWNLLAGPIVAIPFFLIWFLSRGRGMGFGDVKLALGIGWFLGMLPSVSAVMLAVWLGAIVGLSMMLIQRLNKGGQSITIKSEIPFGPFLIIGILCHFFWQLDLLGLGAFLYL